MRPTMFGALVRDDSGCSHGQTVRLEHFVDDRRVVSITNIASVFTIGLSTCCTMTAHATVYSLVNEKNRKLVEIGLVGWGGHGFILTKRTWTG